MLEGVLIWAINSTYGITNIVRIQRKNCALSTHDSRSIKDSNKLAYTDNPLVCYFTFSTSTFITAIDFNTIKQICP